VAAVSPWAKSAASPQPSAISGGSVNTMHPLSRRLIPVLLSAVSMFALLCTDLNGYATNGHTWGTNQVLYYVNSNSVWLSPSAVVSAIQAGAQVWSSQSLANIQLIYAGSTNGSSLTLNNKNEVFLRNDSNGLVGETYWWYDGSGRLVDADVVFHEGGYHFYTGSGCSGGVYLEDVAVHELGHALGLAHSSVGSATMQPSMPGYCDMTQMSLESDDIAGIESLYPPTSTGKNTAPTVSISSPGNGSSFSSGASVTFNGSASDSQDGNLSGSLGWTSSIDGSLGYGASLNRVLSAGTHTITASVRDSGGLSGSARITVSVAPAASSGSVSPDGTVVPTVSQIIDGSGATWTIGSGGVILRNGTWAAGGLGSQILWKSAAIYVLGTDANWWQWTGSGWNNVGRTTPGGTSTGSASPDGTIVPTSAPQIIDTGGAVWTIGSGGSILRNGTQAAGGWGSQILWKSSTLYVLGTDANWWQWSGANWINVGQMTGGGSSADGTTVPTNAVQIIDNAGGVWTIGSGGVVLRNGTSAAGGLGSQIVWRSSTIYVLGTDANWWQWTGSGWINVGRTIPGGSSAAGTTVPINATQIIDNAGAVWTIGSGGAILRNGAWAAGGLGSKILWKSSTIYVFGTDWNWWRWTGSFWVNVGSTEP
jgi:Matrixin/Bacterial Ig domain